MNVPIARPRVLLRWAVPLTVIVAVLAAAVAFATRSDSASPSLPPRTAEQLLAGIRQAEVPGLSGTVVETARLGLPELPSLGGSRGGAALTGLASGSHTIRVWYAGKDRMRLAVTGTLAESDVIRNGHDLWVYESEPNAVTHLRLPAGKAGAEPHGAPGAAGGVTPEEAARQVVAAITPSTTMRVERTARVAGRDAYQLRLEPKDPRSLVDSVLLAVDGESGIPLRVQVNAKGADDPAFETGFTDVQLRAPSAEVFDFAPPPGAKVTERTMSEPSERDKRQAAATAEERREALDSSRPALFGEGWTSVLVVRNVTGDLDPKGAGTAADLLRAAKPVSGPFGQGRLLRTALVSALVTDDGRLYVGAVTPEALQQAAARPLSEAKPLAGLGATR